ncbi:MAG: hypothetical protein LUD38_03180, partial [Parabacteroides sp.]|nr:hypothetical protein [Parabacteroides sp.]
GDVFLDRLSVHVLRSAILSADAIVTFLHQAYLEADIDFVQTREPYERFDHLNQLIDMHVSMQSRVDDDGYLIVTIALPSGDILPLRVESSRLLYQLDRNAYIEALNAARDVIHSATDSDEEQEE